MALQLITAPEEEPVSLAEAKAHLRLEHEDEDSVINLLIRASRRRAEEFLGRALVEQTWELVLDAFPDAEIKLPRPPLLEVVSIKYDDEDGDEQTLPTEDYAIDTVSKPGWVVPADTWPTTLDAINAVRIRYTAGYGPTADSPVELASGVPEDIKAGILLFLAHLYANREAVVVGQAAVALPMGVEALWQPYRVYSD